MVLQKYEVLVISDKVFIILGPFLYIINIYRLISISKMLKSLTTLLPSMLIIMN